MTTSVTIRQRSTVVLLLVVGAIAFVSLLVVTGTMGHILSVFNISYAQAYSVVLAIVNNRINSLPGFLQPIARAVANAVLFLYNHSGLPAAIAF